MTAVLGQFLTQINGFVQAQNGRDIDAYLAIEPPFSDQYLKMITELKQSFPKEREDALEQKCTQSLVAPREGVDGSPTWTPFITFIAEYLCYIRDVPADPSQDYLGTYNILTKLQRKANNALVHPTLGHLMLGTVVRCAKAISRLAIGLDKQPQLVAHLQPAEREGDDGGSRETLPERAANLIRNAFTTCLNDRSSNLDVQGKPEGKKVGIYKIANICLKILFQCRKTRNATMIFENIGMHSPPLSAYPKGERVTYLYYLGRYLFQTNHFYRAQEALQGAYDETSASPQFVRQRRHILVFLVASNLILGRFPSASLFQRPEAQDFEERFVPIMHAMRSGNLAQFRRHLDFEGAHADWFLHFRILLQLRNRCEVHVWRSLVRKTWVLNGTRYNANSREAPLVDIQDLVTVFNAVEHAAVTPQEVEYMDPDFADAEYEEEDPAIVTNTSIESILSSLIDQGFVKGFVAHRKEKFVIIGAKQKGGDVLAAGFPQPWTVIQQKAEKQVPGWRKLPQPAGGGGGRVIRLTDARPAGAA